MNKLLIVFKALSDETRLRIVKLLEKGELCVCEIVAAMGMDQPRVSFHLKVLKKAGILKECKQERWIHYSLKDDDMLVRFLLLVIMERTEGNRQIADDLEKLATFNRQRSALKLDLGNKAKGGMANRSKKLGKRE